MTPLDEDTAADKLVRFALGAFLGALMAWYVSAQWSVVDGRQFATLVATCALVVGGLAALFGNGFIERFIRGRWWE